MLITSNSMLCRMDQGVETGVAFNIDAARSFKTARNSRICPMNTVPEPKTMPSTETRLTVSENAMPVPMTATPTRVTNTAQLMFLVEISMMITLLVVDT